MAISMVLLRTGQCVVAITRMRRIIHSQHLHYGNQVGLKRRSMPTLGFSFIVLLELAGPLNPPHVDLPSALPRYQIP